MAFEKPILIHGIKAASDMSAASQQYCIVKLDSSGNALPCTGATDVPVGVLQNLPQINETAEVLMLGISKIRVAGTDIAVGALVGVDATGRAVALTAGTSTTAYTIGRILKIDNADNDAALVTALVNCLAPCRAA
jgi:hypothetical protein